MDLVSYENDDIDINMIIINLIINILIYFFLGFANLSLSQTRTLGKFGPLKR